MKNLAFSKKFIFTLFAALFSVNLWGQEPIDLSYSIITINDNAPYLCTGSTVTILTADIVVLDYDTEEPVTSGFTISIVDSEDNPITIGSAIEIGQYTLTISASDASCEGEQSKNFYVMPGANDNYTISNKTDWDRFVECYSNGYSFDNLTVKLNDDIEVFEMVYGDGYTPFRGTFDGDGNTITFSYTGTDEDYGIALFYYMGGATIKDLTVEGNIDAVYGFNGGLLCYNEALTTIENVTVSVDISVSDDENSGYCGGFSASTDNLNFINCVYNGKIEVGDYSGGFCGHYHNDEDSEDASFTNCIFDPKDGSHIDGDEEAGENFVKNGNIGEGCYYITSIDGSTQGTLAYKTCPDDEITKTVPPVNGITVYGKVDVTTTAEETYFSNGTNYYSTVTGCTVKFDGTEVTPNTHYNISVKQGNTTVNTVTDEGEYQLVIAGTGNYHGTYTKTFYVVGELDGHGTSEDPFLIRSSADWLIFANHVNNNQTYTDSEKTVHYYSEAHYKLTADITTSTMVGTKDAEDVIKPFKGTFTGRIGNTYGAYTLTFNCGSSFYDATSDTIIAPFRYTDGANIQSLIVEGAIHTKAGKEAGLIGKNTYTTGRATTLGYIINNMDFYCYEELWDAEGGGYAYDGSNIHFSYCSYEGTISASNYHGGFCGKANGNTRFTRCLFDPEGGMYWAENFVYDEQGATINYDGWDPEEEDGCYYTVGNNQEESEQGTMVYVNNVPDGSIGCKITNFHEKQIYKPVAVIITGVNKRYFYTGSDITSDPELFNPGVQFNGTDALVNNYCEWSITPTPVISVGTYEFMVTAPKQGVASNYLGSVTQIVRVVESSNAGWAGLQTKLLGTDATIDLTEDVTAGEGDAVLVVESGRTVTINLNGHNINRGKYQGNSSWSNAVVGGQVLKVNSGATVVIYGNNASNPTGASGKIIGGCNKASSHTEHAENSDGGGIVNKGTLTLNNVTVEGNHCEKYSTGTSRTARGGGIYSGINSKLYIYNCTIKYNEAKGGGGGIYAEKAAEFIMNGTTIQSNKSQDKGGGIRIDATNTANATMNNCTIDNNTVEYLSELSVSNGGGLHLDAGNLTLNGCVITTNRASKFGGGIYIMGGQLHANNCLINNNMSYDATSRFDGCGGGICLLGGKCYLNGGTISGNSSSVIDGGGIYVNSGTLLSIQGTVNITENWKFISNTGGSIQTTNVYLVKAGGKITIAGNLSSSVIGVSKKGDTGVFTSGLNGKGTIANFSSDNSVYSIVSYDNEAKLTTITPVNPPTTGTWNINEPVILNKPVDAGVTSIVIGNNGCLYVNNGGYINGVPITNNTTHAENKLVINGGQVIPSNPGVPATVKKDIEEAFASSQENWYLISSPLVTPTGENPVVYNPISILDKTNLIVKSSNNYPEYDLYRFNEGATQTSGGYELQWENYRANHSSDPDNFTTLAKGRGYLYRNYYDYTITMTGAINIEASIDYTLSYHSTVTNDHDITHDNLFKGFNIIGNPYTHNISKGITGAAIPNTYLEAKYYVLDQEDGSWDLTNDGTAIPPVTGILVQAKSANTLTITNSTTVGGSKGVANNNIWFTVANSKYDDRACVEFRNGRGLNKIAHPNENVPMLYIHHNDEDFASVDMNPEAKQFDLYFEAATLGQYTLTVNPQGNYSYLHLIDKVAEEDIDLLKENEYSFIGSPSDNADRFVVRLNNSESSDNSTFAYQNGNDIVVCGDGELQVFDVMGRLVAQKHVSGVESIATPMTTGVYILRLNENTQKIIIK